MTSLLSIVQYMQVRPEIARSVLLLDRLLALPENIKSRL